MSHYFVSKDAGASDSTNTGLGYVNTGGSITVAVTSNVVTIDLGSAHGYLTGETLETNDDWTTNLFMSSLANETITKIGANTFSIAVTIGDQGATVEASTTAMFCSAFATVQKALDTVSDENDEVTVRAGKYDEQLTIKTSGISGTPIVIRGEKSGTTRLATIDGSVEVASTWVEDTSYNGSSTGTYVINASSDVAIPFKVYWMGEMQGTELLSIYRLSEQSDVDTAADAKDSYFFEIEVDFWDGFEALWSGTGIASDNSHFTGGADPGSAWVRYKDKDNPNSKTMHIANGDPVLDYVNEDWVTVTGFILQGGIDIVHMEGSTSQGLILDDCEVKSYGRYAVHCYNGGSNYKITNNKMHENHIGYTNYTKGSNTWNHQVPPNPRWTPAKGTTLYLAGVRDKYYKMHKVYSNFEFAFCVDLLDSGCDNVTISGNELYDVATDCIRLQGNDGVYIYNNNIHNVSNSALYIGDDVLDCQIYDNSFSTAGLHFRFNNMQGSRIVTNIYRNKCFMPPGHGTHLFFSWTGGPNATTAAHVIWVYHNSFAGGYSGFQFNRDDQVTYPENLYIVNNVFSVGGNVNGTNVYWTFPSPIIPSLGSVDYNWFGSFTPDSIPSVYDGLGNILDADINAVPVWPEVNTVDVQPPEFLLPESGHAAREAGVDISASFTLDDGVHSALSGFSPGYFPETKPNMGADQDGVPTVQYPPMNDITGSPYVLELDLYTALTGLDVTDGNSALTSIVLTSTSSLAALKPTVTTGCAVTD